jgi:hypothetical protein
VLQEQDKNKSTTTLLERKLSKSFKLTATQEEASEK